MIKKIYYFVHDLFSKPSQRGEYSAGFWQEKVRTSVLNSICEQGSILEVGCGEGLFITEIAKKYPTKSVFGVDIWDVILKRAQERVDQDSLKNVELKLSDGAALPYPDSKFAQAVCMNVLFNLPNDEKCAQVIDEMLRVTRKGGQLVMDIRSKGNPFLFLKYKLAPFYDKTVKDLPLRLYSKKKIVNILKAKKCTDIKVRIVAWFLFFPALYMIEAKKCA